jgi:hypothetical protein
MFTVVVAVAAAETRLFVPGGFLPAHVNAPVQGAVPVEMYNPAPVVPLVVSGAQEQASAAPSGPALFAGLAGLVAGATVVLAVQGRAARAQPRSDLRMDETILEKALAGELEEQGAENVFMSEVGWATYLDKECDSSYAMNERVSQASDGYFTPDVFSNPLDVAKSWVESMIGVAKDPLEAGFMTIGNDQSGARSYPKGLSEVEARTIKPKVKDWDKSKRITGIPGYNMFGTPGAKQELPNNFGKGNGINGENAREPGLLKKADGWLNSNLRKLSLDARTLPKPPTIELPKVELPKVELPKVELPEIELPKFGSKD